MKKVLLFVFLLTTIKFSFAQDHGVWNMPNTYTEVISISKSKSEIYNMVKEWFAKTAPKTTYTLQLDDKESGRIIVKGAILDTLKGPVFTFYDVLRYTLAISIKDNKYKYIISDVYFTESGNVAEWADVLLKKQISEMKNFLKSKSDMDF